MANTSTTTFASAIITKHKKELLDYAKGMLVAPRFAVLDHEAKGEDGTVRWNKMLRLPKITSAGSEGTMFGYASARAASTNYIEASPSRFEDALAINEEVDIKSWIPSSAYREGVGNQIARTIEYQTIKALSTGCLRHRIDADTTYEVNGTVDSGSTTTIVDDALTQSDDAWNGGYVTFVNPEGPNYDVTALVSDFVASSDTVTHATMKQTPSTSTKYHMAIGTALASTDVMSTAGMIASSGILETVQAPKFGGGIYRCFLDAAQHSDLWADTTFINSAIYDNSGRLESYRIGRWFDIEFYVASELYREGVDGTENQASGAVHVAPIFGKGAYGLVYWGNGGSKYGVKIMYVDKPDSNNLTGVVRWISWKTYLAAQVLRATSVVGLMTGASAQPVVV